MENVTIHIGIKLLITERRRNHLVSDQRFHDAKFFREIYWQ